MTGVSFGPVEGEFAVTRFEPMRFSRQERERRAWALITLFAVTAALGATLLTFPQDLQTTGLTDLQLRAREARDFFAADFVYIVLYGLLGPMTLWWFGRTIGRDGRPPDWVRWGAILLAGGGIIDAVENTLIVLSLQASGDGALVAAHALAVPKYALALLGVVLALVTLYHAVRAVADR